MGPILFVDALGALEFENTFNPYSDRCTVYDLDDAPRRRSESLHAMLQAAANFEIDSIWIGRDLGIEVDQWEGPVVDQITVESTLPGVFFGGDAAFGPKNIIWAVEHGHQAAISIHRHCQGEDLHERLPVLMNLGSRKMGMHEWSYSNDFDPAARRKMEHVGLSQRFKDLVTEVEMGFTAEQAQQEVERCLNCEHKTVFFE